jgi:cellulose synthase/poly-beta-1,6-N-acetylglucosamine synthase-like glycosyltransferase
MRVAFWLALAIMSGRKLEMTIEASFWIATVFILYVYVGYPVLLKFLRPMRSTPIANFDWPAVSVVLCVRNAENQIVRKLENLTTLDYPRERLEIVVVSDGSIDATNAQVRAFSSSVPLRLVEESQPSGKAVALNRALGLTKHEIILFVDVRQKLEVSALRYLVSHFADRDVGAVSGELIFTDEADPTKPAGVGLYWRYEKLIRRMESRTGSVIGATGAIYAVRRALVPKLPEGLILDDVYVPMHVVKAGKRVHFEGRAVAWDRLAANDHAEFIRKVRTLYGNLQLLELAPWLIGAADPAWGRFVSHKMFRLLVPFAMGAALLASALGTSRYLRVLFEVQCAGFILAAVGGVLPVSGLKRIALVLRTVLVLNLAALVAVARFAARKPVLWKITQVQ